MLSQVLDVCVSGDTKGIAFASLAQPGGVLVTEKPSQSRIVAPPPMKRREWAEREGPMATSRDQADALWLDTADNVRQIAGE